MEPTPDKAGHIVQGAAALRAAGFCIAALERKLGHDFPAVPRVALTDYLPASTLWQGRFDSYRQFKAWLDDNSERVRTFKPRPQRLFVHVADFQNRWAELESAVLDDPRTVKAVANSLAERKAAIDARRGK